MFEISKKTDYGLQLMLMLAANYGLKNISLRQVAQEKMMPYRFLGQIVIPLKEAGLINAHEGMGGGYFLSKHPSKINIAEIIEAIEGDISIAGCSECSRGAGCQPKNIWKQIEKTLIAEMKTKSLSDIVNA